MDALILGGGPAGATCAALLAEAGCAVKVLEKARFPRFHIGESLLPATVALFERLGIHDEVRRRFVHKPGGKWFYGERPVYGAFAKPDRYSSFLDTPYSYMADRAEFDELLLRRAQALGADVEEGAEVREVLHEDGRVRGVRYRSEDGREHTLEAPWVFDASGLAGLVGRALGIRSLTTPRRMAIYSHYQAKRLDPELKTGWFVGQMIYDGWVWTIPLGGDKVSVGLVLSHERFREAGKKPEELLDYWIRESSYLRRGLSRNPVRTDAVHVTGKLGQSCSRLTGDGWTLLGDAGYFIDPCWSSGVHLAMASAAMAADVFLEARAAGRAVSAADYAGYEEKLKLHEAMVTKMVDAFYMASRSRLARRMIPLAQWVPRWHKKAVTFIGGDFTENLFFVNNWYNAARTLEYLSPDRPPPARAAG